MGTVEFVSKFDSLFDYVNSSTIKSPKILQSAVTKNSTHICFLKEARTFIKELHVFEGNDEVTTWVKCLWEWF